MKRFNQVGLRPSLSREKATLGGLRVTRARPEPNRLEGVSSSLQVAAMAFTKMVGSRASTGVRVCRKECSGALPFCPGVPAQADRHVDS